MGNKQGKEKRARAASAIPRTGHATSSESLSASASVATAALPAPGPAVSVAAISAPSSGGAASAAGGGAATPITLVDTSALDRAECPACGRMVLVSALPDHVEVCLERQDERVARELAASEDNIVVELAASDDTAEAAGPAGPAEPATVVPPGPPPMVATERTGPGPTPATPSRPPPAYEEVVPAEPTPVTTPTTEPPVATPTDDSEGGTLREVNKLGSFRQPPPPPETPDAAGVPNTPPWAGETKADGLDDASVAAALAVDNLGDADPATIICWSCSRRIELREFEAHVTDCVDTKTAAQLSADEEFARQLQQQMDMDHGAAQRPGSTSSGSSDVPATVGLPLGAVVASSGAHVAGTASAGSGAPAATATPTSRRRPSGRLAGAARAWVDSRTSRDELKRLGTLVEGPIGPNSKCHVLPRDSSEFTHVADRFVTTGVGVTKADIVSVFRVENPYLLRRYELLKEQIAAANEPLGVSSHGVNELHLFHGTRFQVVPQILELGFNRSYCGHNATVLGKGVYFAAQAGYSQRPTYSPPNKAGIRHVIFARVLCGDFTRGSASLLAPPPRKSGALALFDTVVDNIASPQVYVAFQDAQAFPEYVIAFK